MAFRQRPREKPGEMTGGWIARTQRVNEAQGGKGRMEGGGGGEGGSTQAGESGGWGGGEST